MRKGKGLFLIFIIFVFQINNITYSVLNTESGADLLMKYGFITGIAGDAMVNKSLTRAQVAVILSELKGDKDTAANFALPSGFKDVPSGLWYTPYISYGHFYGYLGGYPDGTYKPDSPVSAKEFAAFMMNAMGYNGDYVYNNVIEFASNKNVFVETKGSEFVRGDAFEALWDVVNQPSKGSTNAIGVELGKLKGDSIINDQSLTETNNKPFKVSVKNSNSVEVLFSEGVEDSDRTRIQLRQYMSGVPVDLFQTISWNGSKTLATLTTVVPLENADYDVIVNDASKGAPVAIGPVKFKVEAEKVTKVTLDSILIALSDDYTGTIKYKAYNQYDEDVTNTTIGKSLFFNCSTDTSTPSVDFEKGLITIHHGSDSTTALKDLPQVVLLIADVKSGFRYTTILKLP